MLDQSTRTAILRLREEGHGARAIARVLKVSRGAVKDVFASGSEVVPHLVRVELAEPLRDDILALYASCKGNLVRVHEELAAKGACFDNAANSGSGSLYLASLAGFFKNKYGALSPTERGQRIYDSVSMKACTGASIGSVSMYAIDGASGALSSLGSVLAGSKAMISRETRLS